MAGKKFIVFGEGDRIARAIDLARDWGGTVGFVDRSGVFSSELQTNEFFLAASNDYLNVLVEAEAEGIETLVFINLNAWMLEAFSPVFVRSPMNIIVTTPYGEKVSGFALVPVLGRKEE